MWALHINGDRNLVNLRGPIPLGHCPACYTGLNKDRTIREQAVLDASIDLGKLSTTTSASDAEVEVRKPEIRDEHGNAELEQVGERYRFNERTGQVDTVPVMTPKQRDLTNEELIALKTKRDQTLDELDTIAVKEVEEFVVDNISDGTAKQ